MGGSFVLNLCLAPTILKPGKVPCRDREVPSDHSLSPLPRTKLLESESMNESLRRSLSRVSARPPYAAGLSPAPALPGLCSPAAPLDTEASDVLRRAKQDLERLKKKERRQQRKR